MCQQEYQQELKRHSLNTIWKIPDDMWEWIQYLLPPQKAIGTPGRPSVPYQRILNGILYVLRTGCQWKAAPKEFSSGSTLHRRFQEWEQSGVFYAIMRCMLGHYDRIHGIDWEWQSADTKMLPAPLGGSETGPNPTDRAKCGTKRHLLVDGRGAPLAVHLSGAHRHDLKGLNTLLNNSLLIERPQASKHKPQHLCLDKAYDAAESNQLLSSLGYIGHIKRQGKPNHKGIGEAVYPPRRWIVERSISWLNNMRKLRTRWEKKTENYQALVMLAAALQVYRLIVLG